jgi:hypothetical protein
LSNSLCLELVLVCLAQHLLLKHLAHNGKAQLHGTEKAAEAAAAVGWCPRIDAAWK